jgi:predicted RNA-binding Zn ribbon-like protein
LNTDRGLSAVPTLTLKIANSGLARRPSGDRHRTFNDPFAMKEAAGAFLFQIFSHITQRQDLCVALSSSALSRLVGWRGALCRLLDAIVLGVKPNPADLEIINSAASRVQRVKCLTSILSVEETVLTEDPVARLSALCIDELSQCDYRRLKKCARQECAMYFYDETRSRSARWHAEDPCGWRSRDERRRSV